MTVNDQERADALELAREVRNNLARTPAMRKLAAALLATNEELEQEQDEVQGLRQNVADVAEQYESAQSEVAQLKAGLQRITEAAQKVDRAGREMLAQFAPFGSTEVNAHFNLKSALDSLAAALSEAPAQEV